jgi:MFS family permease
MSKLLPAGIGAGEDATSAEERGFRYEGWRVAGASGVSLCLASFVVYSFGVFLKPLGAEFGWTREALSSAYGFMAITAAVAAPIFGYVLDRVRVRRVLIPAVIGLAAGFIAMSFLTANLRQFYATYVVLGAVACALSPVGYSRVVSSWFVQRRGIALGLVISGGAVAAIIHPPATQALIDTVGWRGACLVFAGVALCVGVPVVATFIRERPSTSAAVRATVAGVSLGEGLRSRVFWTIVVVYFASSIAMNGALVHMSALLSDRGVPATQAALAVSAMGVASLAGRLTTGWLLDRFFGPLVSVVLLAMVAFGTFILATADSFTEGIAAAVIIGFGMGGEFDVTPYLVSRYFGLRAFSTLFGVAYASSAAAGAVGPILLGRAFDASGSYEALLTRLAVFTIAVAALMLTLPRYRSG